MNGSLRQLNAQLGASAHTPEKKAFLKKAMIDLEPKEEGFLTYRYDLNNSGPSRVRFMHEVKVDLGITDGVELEALRDSALEKLFTNIKKDTALSQEFRNLFDGN